MEVTVVDDAHGDRATNEGYVDEVSHVGEVVLRTGHPDLGAFVQEGNHHEAQLDPVEDHLRIRRTRVDIHIKRVGKERTDVDHVHEPQREVPGVREGRPLELNQLLK